MKERSNSEIDNLREKVSIFQKTFEQEERLVTRLREMLERKEREMRGVVEEYEMRLSEAENRQEP